MNVFVVTYDVPTNMVDAGGPIRATGIAGVYDSEQKAQIEIKALGKEQPLGYFDYTMMAVE